MLVVMLEPFLASTTLAGEVWLVGYTSVSLDVAGVVHLLDVVQRSPSVKKSQTALSADAGFLWRGFLKLRSSAVWGCSPPAGSHSPKLLDVFDSSSALVSDHGDGEDGEFPYPLGNFPCHAFRLGFLIC